MTILGPDSPEQLRFEFPITPEPKEAQLEIVDRLDVLRDDPGAGFLPFTYREAWQATNMLDYLNNKKYPAGTAHHLQEVFLHNKRLDTGRGDGINSAKRALISLPYEYGDYAADSITQRAALYDLDTLLRKEFPNPKPTLAEEFPDGHPGIAPLVRFMDVLALREKGEERPEFDVLRTVEDRDETIDDPNDTAKHKTIHDLYTNPNVSEEVKGRIQEAVDALTIGDVRTFVVSAIENEDVRLAFWKSRLEDTKKHMAAWTVGSRVLAELDQTA